MRDGRVKQAPPGLDAKTVPGLHSQLEAVSREIGSLDFWARGDHCNNW